MIPANDPGASNRPLEAAFLAAFRRVLRSNQLILGPEVEAFEAEFARFLGGETRVVGVASGTDAIELALRAFGIGPGDAVIVPSFTANGTATGVERAGARPVFCDIDPATLTLCPLSAARCARLSPDRPIRAIIPVHLHGRPAAMEPILALARGEGWRVLEDCAQAHGALYQGRAAGTLGDAAAFSFYPTKNLGALGDGGAVATASEELRARLRSLRQYGWEERYRSERTGVNSRLDEIQAALLRVKLTRLPAAQARRQGIAARYDRELAGTAALPAPVPDGSQHAWHQYVVRHPERNALRAFLHGQGVGTAVLYPEPLHRQPAYRDRFPQDPAGLPASERAAAEILCLPIHPGLSEAEQETICRTFRAFPAAARPVHSGRGCAPRTAASD